MTEPADRAIAIVGMDAVMPGAPDGATFWQNIKNKVYSISEVTPDRWDSALYYDSDFAAPDKSYTKLGGWVRDFVWEPMKWRLPIPPKVSEQIDDGQKWSVALSRNALLQAGWPKWNVDDERVAVILGNAIGGEKHYATSMRIQYPEFARELRNAPSFQAVPENIREDIIAEAHKSFAARTPDITEDTMPGELANIIAGRVANLFNFRGPNFTTDAACASGMAAMNTAMAGLADHQYDVAISGGVDRNMGVAAFVKFCKIGALSATGTRPFDAGADGFVMGEGAAIFIMKRLADAERDGDTIYAVLTAMAGSSDGKGKGITAPNPVGQRMAVERAWANAGVDPATVGCMEAHGTSTRVGDVAEVAALGEVFGKAGAEIGSVALGSVKSNIGHLKAAAGTAGLFKMVNALHEKVLPPSLHFSTPNPNIDWASSPFQVNTELREWTTPAHGVRRAGVSAFGFGGTNFHAVLEEYVPGRFPVNGSKSFAGASVPAAATSGGSGVAASASIGTPSSGVASPSATSASTKSASTAPAAPVARKAPLRGAMVVGAADDKALAERLATVAAEAAAGRAPAPTAPDPADLRAPVRVAIDYADAAELADKAERARKALLSGIAAMWKALKARGVFLGRGPAPKAAFLYTGQGSQYVNMLKELRAIEPIVADTFAEADRIMTPLLGKPLSNYIFIDGDDPAAVKTATMQLLQTEITQPAVLTTDLALTRLLAAYGIAPDMVMGHSLGEYGALVAAGILNFEHALEAVSARGREMANVDLGDKGAMAAVIAPMPEIERIVNSSDGYVVIANVNSNGQAVIGGDTPSVKAAVTTFQDAGYTAIPLPVSHAFHTKIVSAASEPLKVQLARLGLQAPKLPIVANIDGEFYPADNPKITEQILDILGRQVASPVQFVKGLHTLYGAGARAFIEVGPKKALQGFAEDVLGSAHDDVLALFTNHPKNSDVAAFNQALCGLYAAGLGVVEEAPAASVTAAAPAAPAAPAPTPAPPGASVSAPSAVAPTQTNAFSVPAATSSNGPTSNGATMSDDRYRELGRLFADFLDRGREVYSGAASGPAAGGPGRGVEEPVVITGAAMGLPGGERVFDDMNVAKLLRGEQFIDLIPSRFRAKMVDKNIVRLVKGEDGSGSFQTIDETSEVIKLAARAGALDVVAEYGIDAERDKALDIVTKLAIGAGFDAMRDAGIPMVMHYKTTSLGTQLPTRWALPDGMRDDTGVVFASAFPGNDAFADEIERYVVDRERHRQVDQLAAIRARVTDRDPVSADIDRRISELEAVLEAEPYLFDRRFLFKALSMGHAQFGEIIGARGPNTQINSACASTTQAVALAQDWINAGRCRRVLVIAGDDATSEHLMEWIGAGFLASGAAATDDVVENAALPFDNRRHGMIIGMGAASIVVESAEAARERGIQPIAEILGTVTANSAFHGSRLDVEHIGGVMENVVRQAEARGVRRHDIAAQTVFVSHETYTPARGGSAAAEINALRSVFGADADSIVIANTKGFTGHPMGVGIEDVTAVKMLETGIVPPIPNFKEIDPSLGALNLSKGGSYPVNYALRLAAGFGSQISMALLRWTPMPDGARRSPDNLGYRYRIIDPAAWSDWLTRMTGYPDADLEVVKRTLRVADTGVPARKAQPAPIAATADVATSAAPASEAVDELPTPLAPAIPTQPSAPAPATAPVAATAPPAPVADPVTDKVLAVVAEVTGYPSDMLALELDLEADLGVDTVKQAEVFATIRETFGIERDENLKLRDYPTLEAVIGFVRDKAGIPAPTAVQAAPAAPAAPVAAVPAQASAPATPAAPAADPVTDKVLSVVAEVTGYPEDMLDLELDLEADLGVDTVKQAEVFATIRETFGIERDENLRLRDYPTLAAVIGFVRDRAGIPAPSAAPAAAAPAAAAPVPVQAAAPAPAAPAADAVTDKVLAVVAEVTGYPQDMLDLELDLEADLGVDTVKQAEVFATIRESFSIERDENLKLRDYPTLAAVIGFVRDKAGIPAPSAAPAAPAAPGSVSAQPAAPAPVPAQPAAPAAGDPVVEKVLAVVADKTGYPEDMLDLELDLEADLGVDTVKQAEVFATIREHFGIERDDTIKLRDYPTLAAVIGFVRDRAGIPAATAAPAAALDAPVAPAPALDSAAPAAGDPVVDKVLEVVADKTGYPPEMLDLDLDLEADLGVDTVKQAEVFATIREHFGIERDDTIKLRDYPTLTAVIGFVRDRAGIPAAMAAPAAAPAPAPAAAASLPAAPAPTAVAAVPAAPAPTAEPSAPAAGDPVVDKVLEVVADKTGYPPEMLDLDLDLEADLGVDTVKQAEVFATIREHFGIERDDSIKLRDYATLNAVIGFVRDRAGIPAAGAPASADGQLPAAAGSPDAAAQASPPAAPRIIGSIEAADRVPRRVPVPVLRPPIGLTKATGVTLGADSRVVLAGDKGGVADVLSKRLRKLGAQVLNLDVSQDVDAIAEQCAGWLADGPVTGVYWLPALDEAGPVEAMDLATWRESLRRRVKALYTTMRALYAADPFLVSATRMGGRHGYDERGALNPLGGAVTGFTKSYKREKSDVLVKAVDFEGGRKTAVLADRLVDEALADPGCVEVGYADNQRWTVAFEERPAADGNAGMEFGPETVFVVTGAAGSIVSAIIADLADAAGGGVFHLLDLTPEPDLNNEDLRAFSTDHDGLKARIISRRKAAGERVTPVMVERELAGIERGAAALAAIEAVTSVGGTAHYHSCDLTNAEAIDAVVAHIGQTSGKIDVLVHAAGIEISRNLPEKEPREYNLVFDVKSDGWFNLIRGIGDMPLGATVGFSSVAGRFGNMGQTDYSAANDLLCKLSSAMRNNRPGTRGIAIDWTAWGGIGMATRGSIPKIMEAAGIDMLPPEAGVATVRRELVAGGTRGEIVVAGRLGMMGAEYDATGGLDVDKIDLSTSGPMVGRVVEMGIHSGLTVETTLDPAEQKFLDDHRIDGTPVLPGVMGIEAFGEVARLLFPDRHLTAVENVDFREPVKFYRDQPRTLTISARFRTEGDDVVASCRLTASRLLPNSPEPKVTTHFVADVRLSTSPLPADSAPKPDGATEEAVEASDIYQIYFHGPAYQVLEKAWRSADGVTGAFAGNLPAAHVPPERAMVMAPRLIELCFQTAGVQELGLSGRMALPLHIDRVVVPKRPRSTEAPLAARATARDGKFDARVVDAAGQVILRLEGYQTVVLPSPLDAALLAPLQRAMAAGPVPAEGTSENGSEPVAAAVDGEPGLESAELDGSVAMEAVAEGTSTDGSAVDGSAADGSMSDGAGADETATDGSMSDGSGADETATDGAGPDGAVADALANGSGGEASVLDADADVDTAAGFEGNGAEPAGEELMDAGSTTEDTGSDEPAPV